MQGLIVILRVIVNVEELVSGYLISTWSNEVSFAYNFQKHKEEVTQLGLELLLLMTFYLFISFFFFLCVINIF